MTADRFDRGILPKFQILFFVLLVAWALAYLAIFTGVLSDVSPSLVYLLGLPALGTLGAQLTSTKSDRMSAENWVAVKRYRDTAAQVQVLLEAMANREVDGAQLMNFKLP